MPARALEFTRPDGKMLRMDELALQRWRGEKVVEERFFYDPAQVRGVEKSGPTR